MGYESSPSCKLVATHCACCCRALVDSVSVELGMGPICRERHGYSEGPAENRKRANQLVYWIAAKQHGDEVAQWVVELRELGFTKLADIIIHRLSNVILIQKDGADYLAHVPYRPGMFEAWIMVPGQHWDRKRKVRVVPATSYAALWELLDRYFAGLKVVGEPRPAPQPKAAPAPEPAAEPTPDPNEIVIKIEQRGTEYLVWPPFREDLIRTWPQEVPDTTWDSANKVRRVPLTSRDALWSFFQRHFVGAVLVTAKGRTKVEARSVKAAQEARASAKTPQPAGETETDRRAFAERCQTWLFREVAERRDLRKVWDEQFTHPNVWSAAYPKLVVGGRLLAQGKEPTAAQLGGLYTTARQLIEDDPRRKLVQADSGWTSVQIGRCAYRLTRVIRYASDARQDLVDGDFGTVTEKAHGNEGNQQVRWDERTVTLSYVIDSGD